MVSLLLLAAARAQDCPAPLTEFDVRQIVRQSNDALFRDDTLGHKRLFGELVEAVPCLDGQLPKDAWAHLLVNEAIVRRVTKEDWQATLGTALAVFPEFPDVPPYLLAEYSPPPPPRTVAGVIPDDATLFVDGVLQQEIPDLEGEHVAQLWRDGRWTSRFLVDEAIPAAWLVPKPPVVVEVVREEVVWTPAGRGALGAGLGFAIGRQLVEDLPGADAEPVGPIAPAFLADNRSYGGLSALASFGVQPIATNASVFWDVAITTMAPTLRTDASIQGDYGDSQSQFEAAPYAMPKLFAGPAALLEELHFGAGAGFVRLRKVEGDVAKLVFYPQPHLVLGVRQSRADFEVGGGLTPSALHASMRGGWLLAPPRPLSWRLGVDVDLAAGWFTEAVTDGRNASLLQVGVVGRFDAAWGRDR